jgi:L-ascorbate metabolism protein UlaG (beta-lactamase superfamily)
MRVEYISHASVLIHAGGRRLLTDPWWVGPCYANQWHVFPRPLNASLADTADVILISHGHQDHLHEPTLRALNKDRPVYYPFLWYEGTAQCIASLGFERVVEADSWRTYDLGEGVSLTYVVNGQDSIMVVEADGRVLVNVNDALHSSDPATIDLFTGSIVRRWPNIDVVLCGFGGASYYPNVFHAPGKDDAAVAKLREEFFAYNFCRISAALNPVVAVPFAADFVLLHEGQSWINATRFPREHMAAMFEQRCRRAGVRTTVQTMYSGDVLDGTVLVARSPYRAQIQDQAELHHLMRDQYPQAPSAFVIDMVTKAAANTLVETLRAHIAAESRHYGAAELSQASCFCVEVLDAPPPNKYEVRMVGREAAVTRAAQVPADAIAHIRVCHAPLLHSLSEDWGADDLLIGYGCRIEAKRQADLPWARLCAELLMRHPHPGAYLKAHPRRALRYLLQNRLGVLQKIKRRLSGVRGTNVVGGSFWVTDSSDAIRDRVALHPAESLHLPG